MRKGIGAFCIVLGVLCLLGAIGLVLYNRWEASQAEQVSQSLLQEVKQAMAVPEGTGEAAWEKGPGVTPEMATIAINGFDCIGVLSIPVLEVELPVLADWSYEKLKSAPCHYYGSCYGQDFVIAAHNYRSHFGRLSQLQEGDLVLFIDAAGNSHYYEVVLTETLPPEATEEMIVSGFDLSLYTCTPGGGSRVTVRCNRK